MRIMAHAAPPLALSRFAVLVEPPASPGDRRHYSDWLAPVAGCALQFHLNHVAPSALPLQITQVEAHPHAAQVFLPVDVDRYVVTVMPGKDTPDPSGAVSVILPGTVGLAYRPGAWHAGITVLGRPSHFAVLMWRGAPDDDLFAEIPPLSVAAPGAMAGLAV
ncbi:ureidoglycolate lyase [uncultured Roseicyclus sp.]|jgi:ureidoglycolate lyase|uniref:ureidoglycolate lyase n=1 Tax=uncultured Roseicyclus sp. TaxID=543072 RepID=UPI00261C2848|nr:ureidoglycolate lyase [uncultured Roseicyclus sp.]